MMTRPRQTATVLRVRRGSALALAWLLLASTAGAGAPVFSEQGILGHPAPGPHAGLDDARRVPPGFGPSEPFVATYYFYWYDRASGMHFVNADGSDALTDHPAQPEGYRYRRPDWHRRELLAMIDAGIDAVLPVFWGNPADAASPSGPMRWSFDGLPPLVAAWKALRGEGRHPPTIGLFYDTSTLRHNAAGRHVDLTTDAGRAWFYATVRDFFSLIPPPLWATVEGRPIVFLYSAGFAKDGTDDARLLPYVRKHFARDFGGAVPFIVVEQSWHLPADAVYAWGGAFGLRVLDVASLGPGYDDSAVPGRTTPRADREGGRFYRRHWRRLLAMDPARRPRIAAVETWNEWHEGTDIAPSREYGRTYVDLTRRFADLWKARRRLEPGGPYAGADRVTLMFGAGGARGLTLKTGGDGLAETGRAAGSACVRTRPNEHGPACYLYFDVDESFYCGTGGPLCVTVEYLDAGDGAFALEYDSADRSTPHGGAYKRAGAVARTGTATWKRAAFSLPDPWFAGRQNLGADLRLVVPAGSLAVRSVAVQRPARRAVAPEQP